MRLHRPFVIALGLAGLLLPAARAEEKDPLAALAWCVGGQWTAELKGPDGTPFTAAATFDWAGHKKALKFVVTFTAAGKATVQYEGSYWYHPGKKHVLMHQLDKAGNVTESTVTFTDIGFKQANVVTRLDGTTTEQRAEVVRDGDDAFKFRAMVPKDGQWVEAVAFTYKRTRPAK